MNKKNALILGVTGQGGSFMAKFLLKKNYNVFGLVRKSATGKKCIDELYSWIEKGWWQ